MIHYISLISIWIDVAPHKCSLLDTGLANLIVKDATGESLPNVSIDV